MIYKTLITTTVLLFQNRQICFIILIYCSYYRYISFTHFKWSWNFINSNHFNMEKWSSLLYHISMDTSGSLAATSLVRFVMLSQKSFKLKINWLLQKTNNVPIFQAHWIYFFVVLSKLSSSVIDLLYNVRISCKQFNLYQNLFCFSITLFPNCH